VRRERAVLDRFDQQRGLARRWPEDATLRAATAARRVPWPIKASDSGGLAGAVGLPAAVAVHAGLLLLLPAICEVGLPDLVVWAGYPATRELSAWQSAGTLLAKCARKPRVSHAGTLADDEGLAFTLGLTALPKTTHLGSYSWRVRRESSRELLAGLVRALRPASAHVREAQGQDQRIRCAIGMQLRWNRRGPIPVCWGVSG
jgi:hypothetical protein